MVYEPKNSTKDYRNAVIMMLDCAAHYRKLGNYVAARRAILTIKSWNSFPA